MTKWWLERHPSLEEDEMEELETMRPLWTAPRDGTEIYLHLRNAPPDNRRRGRWRKPDKHVPDGCWHLKSYGRCDYEIVGWSFE